MTKLSKILALMLAIIMVFNIGVLATDTPDETEDATTTTQAVEESTTEDATEETTTEVAEESTTEETTTEVTTEETTDVTEETTEATTEETTDVTEESTTEESTTEDTTEETTTEAVEESTTEAVTEESTTEEVEESTTAPEETTSTEEETTTEITEETTTEVAEESTTTPEEVTTTTPDVTEPEVELPATPANITAGKFADGKVTIQWDKVDGANGYDVYLKSGENWELQGSFTKTKCSLKNIFYNSKYYVGVRAYSEIDGVKYESEMAEYTVLTGTDIPDVKVTATASSDNIVLKWDALSGVSGYRVYIRKDGKWVKLTSITDTTYTYKKAVPGETYKFAVKPYSKGTEGIKFGSLKSVKIVSEDYSKTTVKATDKTESTISIKWSKIKNASSYRVYIYKNGKWTYYKGITKNTYTIKGLKDATNYKIKVKPCFKVDGKVYWGAYSNTITVATAGKTVKAKYISELKKYFTDGDWCVTIGGFKDDVGFDYTITLAVKGDDLYVKYDYKESMLSDFAYLIQTEKEKVYMIRYKAKTYELLPEDEALDTAITFSALAMIFDMESAKGVKAKTAIYSGKSAIAEIYKDNILDTKKTYYFIDGKLKALKLTYSDGTTESFKSIKITDTPSASYFKLPSGYKNFTA